MSQETYTKGGKEERGAEILPKLAHILGGSLDGRQLGWRREITTLDPALPSTSIPTSNLSSEWKSQSHESSHELPNKHYFLEEILE